MSQTSLFSGEILRRGLAGCVVLAQLLGSIGIMPAMAESDSTPFPCRDHPCGCRTALQCWSGACCCMTMREKVAWAIEHNIVPPAHAAEMAARESAPRKTEEPTAGCCTRGGTKKASCCESSRIKETSQPESQTPGQAGWVAGLFAQKCHGHGYNELGLLNIGVPPEPQAPWLDEPILADCWESPDQNACPRQQQPLVPPPKC